MNVSVRRGGATSWRGGVLLRGEASWRGSWRVLLQHLVRGEVLSRQKARGGAVSAWGEARGGRVVSNWETTSISSQLKFLRVKLFRFLYFAAIYLTRGIRHFDVDPSDVFRHPSAY